MRRFALIGLTIAAPAVLPGCAYVGSPFVGFGGFIGDTHSFHRNPNQPAGDAENVRRVRGEDVAAQPLLPEAGNVWPGPTPPDPTLEDIERQQNQQQNQPSPQQPGQPPRGSSSPPGSIQPNLPPLPNTSGPIAPAPNQAPPQGRTFVTPQGPATANPGNGGVQTFTAPGGGQGIVVPNGNGTSTLIGPDGTVTTVPNAR